MDNMKVMPLQVEVVHARQDRQKVITLSINPGCSVRDVVRLSGIVKYFPGLDLDKAILGVYGKVIQNPESYSLTTGDRIEIYRPLTADPKELRRLRDEKSK